MRNVNTLFLAAFGLLASYTAQAQVGVGTITPRTMLDVNGAVSLAEATATVASNAATIPMGYSLVRLTGTATASVALTAASAPAPVAGQQLVIYNALSSYSAIFAGQSIGAGQSLYLLYSNGAWQPVGNAAAVASSSGWGLAGNAGTTAGPNFLGTTDNADVIFKRNNVLAAQLTVNNTSFGTGALLNTTAAGNMAVGYQAGRTNTSGIQNQFLGYQSGLNNTTGGNNQFAGYRSGLSNSTGHSNLYVGNSSGRAGSTNSYNTIFGDSAGLRNTASFNQFVGYASGIGNTTGGNNLFVGYRSGITNTTGTNNTLLGTNANVATAALTNATAIGNGATVSASNTIQLGNANITALRCKVALTVTSDARFKYDVQANVPGLAFISQLHPVTYRLDGAKMAQFTRTGVMPSGFTRDSAAAVQTGFLAQDVERAAQALHYRFDGVNAPANSHDYYGLSYSQFVVPLVKAVQEQQAQIDALKAENTGLKASLADKASASTLTELQTALQTLRVEVQTLRASGTTASLK
jgi:hypothetical protein